MKVRRHHIIASLILGASLLLGNIPLQAAAPSSMPQVKRETVLFKACSAKKNAERKKEMDEYLRKKREEHQKMREKNLRKK